MTHIVRQLYTYPVKSLSPHPMDKAILAPGASFPFDRSWALKKGVWDFDAKNPEYKFKTFFHVLMQDERLAALNSTFDVERGTLRLEDQEGGVVEGEMTTPEGRTLLETWLKNFLTDDVQILNAHGFSFSDVPMKVVSIINLASVKALGEAVGAELDPLRFRGNIHVEGAPAWLEFDLVGKEFSIGDCRFETVKRIQRCAATNVNLENATRDQNLPRALMKNFGHADMGIYAKVIGGGTFKIGDEITL